MTGYSFDTSSFSNGWVKLYPPDVFPGVWLRMSEAIAGGVVRSPDEVREELSLGDPELMRWARNQAGLFVPTDALLQQEVRRVLEAAPRLVDLGRRRSLGDPWVIAMARLYGLTVVTEERSRPTRPRIPDVCRMLGVRCVTLLDVMRELEWRFPEG